MGTKYKTNKKTDKCMYDHIYQRKEKIKYRKQSRVVNNFT